MLAVGSAQATPVKLPPCHLDPTFGKGGQVITGFGHWSDTSFGSGGKVTTSLTFCLVPNVKGKKLVAAELAILTAHCSVGKETKAFSRNVRLGRVISQKPKAAMKPVRR